jgi:hypothetical protein
MSRAHVSRCALRADVSCHMDGAAQVKWAKRNDALVRRIARDGEEFVSKLLLHHGVDCLSLICAPERHAICSMTHIGMQHAAMTCGVQGPYNTSALPHHAIDCLSSVRPAAALGSLLATLIAHLSLGQCTALIARAGL